MSDEIYRKLAKVLDTLPSGFPSTESGLEIKILKKIFASDEADLFCDLKLNFETPAQIAKRIGRPLEELDEKLTSMWKRGLVFGAVLGPLKVFKMMPWIVGIWEMQLNRLDRELAELAEQYSLIFGEQFIKYKPQVMQVIPIEKEISAKQEALPYEQVSNIIESSKSFAVAECICRKEQHLLGKECKKPRETCLALAPLPGIFENSPWGRPISKEEAYGVLQKSEKAGLVHMTGNVQSGHFFICNCCGCCCGVLRGINTLGIPPNIVNSHFYAEVDPNVCIACGTCKDERCQINAIEQGEETYRVIKEKCIGCGLCVSTCPSDAIKLVHKQPEELISPAKDEMDWFEQRACQRGVDFSSFK
jgi:Na+-translocating ferredoxin:NAD+ oxidoreductase subunit B